MTGLRTLWQRFGGFTAVLMVFALMFGPAADAAICSDEAPPAAAQQSVDHHIASTDAMVAIDDGAPSGVTHDGDDAGLCQHGHCHHAASYLPAMVAEVSAHASASTPTIKLASQHPRSRAPSRLDRPPRA